MRYNQLRRLPNRLLGGSLASVRPSVRKWLQPPWPDLVLAIGRRSVPVARCIRCASGGRTKLVQLGNPRLDPEHFDLVIATPQYGVRSSDNVLQLPLAMASPTPREVATDEDRAFLDALPRPHRLMVIGGPNKHWRVDETDATLAATWLMERSDRDGGTLIVVGSPRTEASVQRAVGEAIAGSRHRHVVGKTPRYQSLLQDADEIHVTADSISMLSEAIFTGKPVGMIPARRGLRGTLAYALPSLGLGRRPKPDLPAAWNELRETELVGTVDAPCAGQVQNPLSVAVDAVKALLAS